MIDSQIVFFDIASTACFTTFHSLQLSRLNVQISENISYTTPPSFNTLKRLYKRRLEREKHFFYVGLNSLHILSVFGLTTYNFLYRQVKKEMKRKNYFRKDEKIQIIASSLFSSSLISSLILPCYNLTLYKRDCYRYYRLLSVNEIVKDFIKNEGIRGLYKGYQSLAILALNGSLVYSLNDILSLTLIKKKRKSNYLIGALTGFIYSIILQPFCSLKRVHMRLKDRQKYIDRGYYNIIYSIRHLYHREGLSGFYRGYFRTNLTTIPSFTLLFAILHGIDLKLKGKEWEFK